MGISKGEVGTVRKGIQRFFLGVFALGTALCLCLASSAPARQIQPYHYSGKSFPSGGAQAAAIAFDVAAQKVLVVDVSAPKSGLKVSRFTASGTPDPFSGRGGSSSSFFVEGSAFDAGSEGLAIPPRITIDNSGTATDGNFYISLQTAGGIDGGKVYGFAPDGAALPGFPATLPSACGVAVGPDGGAWVANKELGSYREYDPTSKLVKDVVNLGVGTSGCRVAVDSQGSLYLTNGDHITKYGSGAGHPALFDLTPGTPPLAVDLGNDNIFTLSGERITEHGSSGETLGVFGEADPVHFEYAGLAGARDLAVDSQTHDVYALEKERVDVFSPEAEAVTVPTATTESADHLHAASAILHGSVDPDGQATTDCFFEWGTGSSYKNTAPCAEGNVFAPSSGTNAVSAVIGGLAKGVVYHFRLVSENANGIPGYGRDLEFSSADPPVLSAVRAARTTTDSAQVKVGINPNGAATSFRVEVGTDTSYGSSFPVPDAAPVDLKDGSTITANHAETQEITGLQPETIYHYRVVAHNAAGITEGADHTFRTFSLPSTEADTCPNAHVRQQTNAAQLPGCRAYELVSAANTGGYDLRSDLTAGDAPLPTSPSANDAALYSMQSGTIPGISGNPTNRGADPYVATRGATGWSTRYVGLPSNNPNAGGPFASPLSGFDSQLDSFAFGGNEICSPCFEDGSTNVPLRMATGNLVKGMAGSLEPGPAESAGTVKAPLSADGSHFVFGTTSRFEPDANSNGTDATLYERDLGVGTTEVISKTDSGETIANGSGIAELGISADGSRVVVGELVSTDSAGNHYYHLYMHLSGVADTIDLTPDASDGALYAGMSADGAKVYFTTKDPLTTAAAQDTDTSADLFRADVSGGSATLSRISVGSNGAGNTDECEPAGNSFNPAGWNVVPGSPADCSAVAIGGGGGVASDSGGIYFLSPEQLDGSNGLAGAPNLYLSQQGGGPRFVATLESGASTPVREKARSSRSFGSFLNPEGIALDRDSGDTYVLDNGETEFSEGAAVQKFDASGNVVGSFGVGGKLDGSNTPEGSFLEIGKNGEELLTPAFSFGVATQLAVDNDSSSPAYGDLYVPDLGHAIVDKFDSSGNYITSLEAGLVSGVAVNQANGDVYTIDIFGSAHVYNAAGSPVNTFMVSGEPEPYSIAVDSSGTIYISNGSNTSVYDSAGAFVKLLDSNPSYGVAVDPADDHVYVSEGSRVVEFDEDGNETGVFGSGVLGRSVGLAVDSNTVTVSNGAHGNVSVFGPPETPRDRGYDSPLVINSVKSAETRKSEDFQTTPSGDDAVFSSTLPLGGIDSNGKYEIFRYDNRSRALDCVSCSPTEALSESDATLSSAGSNITDSGDVFFTTAEQLALRDTNERRDVYEWSNATQSLISTGTSESDSSLLSVTPDGTNAFFFTRERLVPEDQNGSLVRLYTARMNGGFEFGPPDFQCSASDECHGAGSEPPPPLAAATTAGSPGQFQPEPSAQCRTGRVKRRGKCVKRHHRTHTRHHKRATKGEQGGGK